MFYLVMLVHHMDDLPVFLTTDRDEAIERASQMDEMPSFEIRELFNTDCSTPVCVKIVTFSQGVPVAVNVVKEFNDDTASV